MTINHSRKDFNTQLDGIGLNDDNRGCVISPSEFVGECCEDPKIGPSECNAIDVLCGIGGDSGTSEHHKNVGIKLLRLIDEFNCWRSVSKRVAKVSSESVCFEFTNATVMSHELESSIGRQNFSIKKLYGQLSTTRSSGADDGDVLATAHEMRSDPSIR
jgi:hypothetical protein